ncbi:YIP1 family protein [Rhodophyticola sp. CCM32]|uniref:YIP1 family protein n=1 Tax=Rhodophyticola sp. CCM32 TaxID=2916397 RepID=UPI00107F583C|nr:YIP1 family protein [Rhodophyticola sp. CCM32]QBY00413.1 YIP1 family protein [Rhodophyticola sp. CCM32]
MTDTATLGALLRLARHTVANPREGAATMLSFAPSRQALWLMFALVVVLSTFFGAILGLLRIRGDDAVMAFSPVFLGLTLGVILFVAMHAIYRIGRAFGGTGRFEETMLLVIWLQSILTCVLLLRILALLVLPWLEPILVLAELALLFWLLIHFIAVLHGFQSLGQVFVMVILSIIGIAFLAGVIFEILGVPIPQGGL